MKRLLKKIFPIVFLKQVFLVYNRIKITTWDKLVYRTYKVSQAEIILAEVKNPFLALGVDVSKFPQNIKEKFSRWSDPKWTQNQYIISINKRVSIDPETGWAVTDINKLIYPSLGFSHAPYVHKPRMMNMLARKKNMHVKKMISLRDTGEENYFHFFNDVLAKIWFLKDYNQLEEDSTIVISHKLWERQYFQFFHQNTFLKELNWHIQKDEWITGDSAIFCKPFTHTKKYLSMPFQLALPFIGHKQTPRRIFLTRSRTSLRFLENSSEIEDLLMSYQFVVIETSQIPFLSQVELFHNAEAVIGVHGAGLTNIIFKDGKPLKVLELFHPNEYLPFHYVMLCKIYGYEYNAIQGEEGDLKGKGGFKVNVNDLTYYCSLL